jgi:hypothetical protein
MAGSSSGAAAGERSRRRRPATTHCASPPCASRRLGVVPLLNQPLGSPVLFLGEPPSGSRASAAPRAVNNGGRGGAACVCSAAGGELVLRRVRGRGESDGRGGGSGLGENSVCGANASEKFSGAVTPRGPQAQARGTFSGWTRSSSVEKLDSRFSTRQG